VKENQQNWWNNSSYKTSEPFVTYSSRCELHFITASTFSCNCSLQRTTVWTYNDMAWLLLNNFLHYWLHSQCLLRLFLIILHVCVLFLQNISTSITTSNGNWNNNTTDSEKLLTQAMTLGKITHTFLHAMYVCLRCNNKRSFIRLSPLFIFLIITSTNKIWLNSMWRLRTSNTDTQGGLRFSVCVDFKWCWLINHQHPELISISTNSVGWQNLNAPRASCLQNSTSIILSILITKYVTYTASQCTHQIIIII